METDSDSEEESLISENLRKLKSQAFTSSQSQSLFSQSQRERHTQSAQRYAWKGDNSTSRFAGKRNSHAGGGFHRSPVLSNSTSKKARAGPRPHSGPASQLQQDRGCRLDSSSSESSDWLMQSDCISSPDKPVMFSLSSNRARRGGGSSRGRTAQPDFGREASEEDVVIPETSGMETISETDCDHSSGDAARETAASSIASVPKLASPLTDISVPEPRPAQVIESTPIRRPLSNRPHVETRWIREELIMSEEEEEEGGEITCAGDSPGPSGSKPVDGRNSGADISCQTRQLHMPTDKADSDTGSEDEELALPTVTFSSKRGQQKGRQLSDSMAAGTARLGEVVRHSGSQSSGKRLSRQQVGVKQSMKNSSSHEASSSDADIESVDSGSDWEGDLPSRGQALLRSESNNLSSQTQPPEAPSEGDESAAAQNATVTYDDSPVEHSQYSPSIFQQDTECLGDDDHRNDENDGLHLVQIAEVRSLNPDKHWKQTESVDPDEAEADTLAVSPMTSQGSGRSMRTGNLESRGSSHLVSLDSDMTQPCALSDLESSQAPPLLSRVSNVPSMLGQQVSDESIPPPLLTKVSSGVVPDSCSSTTDGGTWPSLSASAWPSLSASAWPSLSASAWPSSASAWPALSASALGQVKKEKEAPVSVPGSSQAEYSPVYKVKREKEFAGPALSVTVSLPRSDGISTHTQSLKSETTETSVPMENLTISVSMSGNDEEQALALQGLKRDLEESAEGTSGHMPLLPVKAETDLAASWSRTSIENPAEPDDGDAGSDGSQCLFDNLPTHPAAGEGGFHTGAEAVQKAEVYVSDAEEDVGGGPLSRIKVESHAESTVQSSPGRSDAGAEPAGYTVEDDLIVVFDSDEEEMFSSFTQVTVKAEVTDDEADQWCDEISNKQLLAAVDDHGSDKDDGDGDCYGKVPDGDADFDNAMDSADDLLVAASHDLDLGQGEKPHAQPEKMPSVFSQPTLIDEDAGELGENEDDAYLQDTLIDDDAGMADEGSCDKKYPMLMHDHSKAAESERVETEDEKGRAAGDFDDDMDDALYRAATQIDSESIVPESSPPRTDSHPGTHQEPSSLTGSSLQAQSSRLKDFVHLSFQVRAKQTARKSMQSRQVTHTGKQTARKSMQSQHASTANKAVQQSLWEKAARGMQQSEQTSDIDHSKPELCLGSGSKASHPGVTSDVVDLTMESSNEDETNRVLMNKEPPVRVKQEAVAPDQSEVSDSASEAHLAAEEEASHSHIFDGATLVDEEHLGGHDSSSDSDASKGHEQHRSNSEKAALFDVQTLADAAAASGGEDEEFDVYAVATQRDDDPYLAQTQVDLTVLSSSDSESADGEKDSVFGERGEKRKHSDAELESDSDKGETTLKSASAEESMDHESLSESDSDLCMKDDDEGSTSRKQFASESNKDTEPVTGVKPTSAQEGKSAQADRTFDSARETMMNIKRRNQFVGAIEIEPQEERRRRGKKVGLKQKLCHPEDPLPIPPRDSKLQRSLSSQSADCFMDRSGSERKAPVRSVSAEETFPGPSTSSDRGWLGKKPDPIEPKAKSSAPSFSKPQQSRKRARRPRDPGLSEFTKKARLDMQARQMRVIMNPALSSDSRHRDKLLQTHPDMDTDVELPNTQEVFNMRLPLMTATLPVSKQRLARTGEPASRSSSSSSVSESRHPSISAATEARLDDSEEHQNRDGKPEERDERGTGMSEKYQTKSPSHKHQEHSSQHRSTTEAAPNRPEAESSRDKKSHSRARKEKVEEKLGHHQKSSKSEKNSHDAVEHVQSMVTKETAGESSRKLEDGHKHSHMQRDHKSSEMGGLHSDKDSLQMQKKDRHYKTDSLQKGDHRTKKDYPSMRDRSSSRDSTSSSTVGDHNTAGTSTLIHHQIPSEQSSKKRKFFFDQFETDLTASSDSNHSESSMQSRLTTKTRDSAKAGSLAQKQTSQSVSVDKKHSGAGSTKSVSSDTRHSGSTKSGSSRTSTRAGSSDSKGSDSAQSRSSADKKHSDRQHSRLRPGDINNEGGKLGSSHVKLTEGAEGDKEKSSSARLAFKVGKHSNADKSRLGSDKHHENAKSRSEDRKLSDRGGKDSDPRKEESRGGHKAGKFSPTDVRRESSYGRRRHLSGGSVASSSSAKDRSEDRKLAERGCKDSDLRREESRGGRKAGTPPPTDAPKESSHGRRRHSSGGSVASSSSTRDRKLADSVRKEGEHRREESRGANKSGASLSSNSPREKSHRNFRELSCSPVASSAFSRVQDAKSESASSKSAETVTKPDIQPCKAANRLGQPAAGSHPNLPTPPADTSRPEEESVEKGGKSQELRKSVEKQRGPPQNGSTQSRGLPSPTTEAGGSGSVPIGVRPPTPPRKSDKDDHQEQPASLSLSGASPQDSHLPRPANPKDAHSRPKCVRFNPNVQYESERRVNVPALPAPPTLPTFQELLENKMPPQLKASHFQGNPLQKRLPPLQEQRMQQQQQQQFVFKPLVVESQGSAQPSGSGGNMLSGQRLLDTDDLITHLLGWSPQWLQEHERNLERFADSSKADSVKLPPVVDLNQLYPLLTAYGDRIVEYQQICFKLLLLETWEDIFRSWKAKKLKYPPCHVVLVNTSRPQAIISLWWIGLITGRELKCRQHPVEGDVVEVRMVGRHLSSGISTQGSTGDTDESCQLAYVDKIKISKCQDVRQLIKRHCPLKNHPTLQKKDRDLFILEITIKTRYRKFAPSNKDLITIAHVGSLTSAERRFVALQMLPRCALMRDILNPSRTTLSLSRVPENLVVFPQLGRSQFNVEQSLAIRTMFSAVMQPVACPRICLLHGPPGTGKSHTIIGLILMILHQWKKDAKICLAAPSNAAADELLRRLLKRKSSIDLDFLMVRIGNTDSIHPDVKEHSLERKVSKAQEQALLKKKLQSVPESVKTENERLQQKISKMNEKMLMLRKENKMPQAEALQMEIEKMQRKKDVLTRQINQGQQHITLTPAEKAAIYAQELKSPQVVCGTLSSFGQLRIINMLCRNATENRRNNNHFTCAIIDEATQATELDSLIPLQYGMTKLFLVGDPNQLPPTVLSTKAQSLNYGLSLFERLYNNYQDECSENPVMMLHTQYRMDPAICRFPSQHIYSNLLRTDEKVKENCQKYPLVPYLLFDVQGGQELLSQSGTLSNEVEAECTAVLCEQLVNCGLRITPQSIGIICPYAGQKRLVSNKLLERGIQNVEVNTVDGFQGREKHVIILSCVRANSYSGGIGFMADKRRMNVALTRAKYALYIIAHLESLRYDRDWNSLIRDAEKEDRQVTRKVRSVEEFPTIVQQCCIKPKFQPAVRKHLASKPGQTSVAQ